MKKSTLLLAAFTLLFFQRSMAQLPPVVTSWIINTTGATGYGGIETNVQKVQYSTDSVYISCTCIPGYSIGPWKSNPNTPSNQNFVFVIPKNPTYNSGTPTTVSLGHIGTWSNGVSIYNADDGMTYNNDGIWHRNAYYFEGVSFDTCLGHPAPNGEYHHHINPRCLYNDKDSTHHSPIIGYAFDGFPIYGAYGYTDSMSSSSAIKRMKSSYQTRNITTRDTLPNGTVASAVGPVVNSTYPIGDFIQDYTYVKGSGDLDAHNGRFCVTPEYPSGTYAYFITIDSKLTPVYPYVLGLTYYGHVPNDDVKMGGGHVTIIESTTTYTPTSVNNIATPIKFQLSPNPTQDYAFIYFDPSSANNIKGALYDMQGNLLQDYDYYMQPSISYSLDLSKYPAGTYLLHLQAGSQQINQKIIKVK